MTLTFCHTKGNYFA